MSARSVNDRQFAVLQWIADGCPAGVWEGDAHKTSAAALESRRLVRVSRRNGKWQAVLTPAGKYFLDHEEYPPGHWPEPAKRPKTLPRLVASTRKEPPARVPSVSPTVRLVADVQAAGGRLVVSRRESRQWSNLVSAAMRYNLVPAGMLLRVEYGSSWGEQVITLTAAPTWMTTVAVPIPVAEHLRRPHPVITMIAEDSNLLPFRASVRHRALRILDALVKEVEHRGYTARHDRHLTGREARRRLLTIEVQGQAIEISVKELDDRTEHVPTAKELADHARHSWRQIPEYDYAPSGRLRLDLTTGIPVQQAAYEDGKRGSLEDKLGEVLREIELRAEANLERQAVRARELEARRIEWEHAIADATLQATEQYRAQRLHAQVDSWHDLQRLDAYLEAMVIAIERLPETERAEAAAWLTWAQRYRDQQDPLLTKLHMPQTPEFKPEELRPFLRGQTPYAP